MKKLYETERIWKEAVRAKNNVKEVNKKGSSTIINRATFFVKNERIITATNPITK